MDWTVQVLVISLVFTVVHANFWFWRRSQFLLQTLDDRVSLLPMSEAVERGIVVPESEESYAYPAGDPDLGELSDEVEQLLTEFEADDDELQIPQ